VVMAADVCITRQQGLARGLEVWCVCTAPVVFTCIVMGMDEAIGPPVDICAVYTA